MPKKDRAFRRKIKKRKHPKTGLAGKSDEPIQIDDLILKAEADINTFNYESAMEHCQSALLADAQNVKAMEMLAGIFLETQDIEQAQNLLLQCIEISPDVGHSKYLSLGQLSVGKEALEYYKKGISIMEKALEDIENSQPEAAAQSPALPTNRALSDVYCSIAELYVTDLCDEEDAEALCESSIQNALRTDESNPDAYQSLANLRIIQENDEEAKSAMVKSLSFWLPQSLEEDTQPENEVSVPDFESRIKTSQLLIELSMFEEASQVLERMLDEFDKIFLVWYLLGWANYVHGDIYMENAYHYFRKAKEVALKYGCEDKDQLAHVNELLPKLLSELGEEDDFPAIEELNLSSSDSENEMDAEHP